MIDGCVVCDLEDPGGKLEFRPVGFDRVQRLDESLLRQILGQLAIPDHPIEQGEKRPLVPSDELPVRGLLAPPGQGHDVLIAPGGETRLSDHAWTWRLRRGFPAGYIERLC